LTLEIVDKISRNTLGKIDGQLLLTNDFRKKSRAETSHVRHPNFAISVKPPAPDFVRNGM
jgi:hypothetical protein